MLALVWITARLRPHILAMTARTSARITSAGALALSPRRDVIAMVAVQQKNRARRYAGGLARKARRRPPPVTITRYGGKKRPG